MTPILPTQPLRQVSHVNHSQLNYLVHTEDYNTKVRARINIIGNEIVDQLTNDKIMPYANPLSCIEHI